MAWIDSVCTPEQVDKTEIWGQLGRFTPCFLDIVVLGLSHALASILFIEHIVSTYRSHGKRYALAKGSRFYHKASLIAASFCILVPVLQLNGRLGQAAGTEGSYIAPYEYAETALAVISWVLLGWLLCAELGLFGGRGIVRERRWHVRFAVCLATSSELVKLRFLLTRSPEHNYFFWLYITYVGCQLVLTSVALLWHPADEDLMLLVEDGYMPLSSTASPEAGICPEATAGLLSNIFFSWIQPMMSQGYKAPLTLKQVWKLPPNDRVETIGSRFDRHWAKQLQSSKPSLARACWSTTAGLFLYALPFKLICDASQFVGPVFLNLLLKVIADPDAPVWMGYVYAGGMFMGTFIGTLADNQHFQAVMRAGFQLRGLLASKVHAQVFRLSPAARGRFSSGRIFNLVSADAETISQLCMNVFNVVSAPLRIISAIYLLWRQLGAAAFVAAGFLCLVFPINTLLTSMSSKLLKSALAHTDERTKLEGELAAGMEVVKCSGWTDAFHARILKARNSELAMLLKVALLQALVTFVLFAVPTVVPVLTFAAYLWLGHELSAAEAFTALALLNVLRFPLFMLPQLVQQLISASVSLNRIQEFLAAETLQEVKELPPARPGETAISLVGDFAWDPEKPPSLSDIHLDIKAGQLVVVVGSTGSGKSSLLTAMLNAMIQVYGPPPTVRGRVAYVPQAAFIAAGTVRENILFGQPFEQERYDRAVQAACLDADLQLLPGGDQTELGDRGLNVSGGQKQRISIARALYHNADVVLLDDPLSALDAKVGRRVFEKSIKGMLSGRTVVLTTNQLQFVQAADLVVYMSGGHVAEAGSFSDLMSAGLGFASLMKETQVEEHPEEEGDSEELDAEVRKEISAGAVAPLDAAAAGGAPPNGAAPGVPAGQGKLTSEERVSEGVVLGGVTKRYLSAMGGFWIFFYLMTTFIAVEGFRVWTNVWLSDWTGDEEGEHDAWFYLKGYAAISAAQLFGQAINAVEVARLCQTAARRLHEALLKCLLHAPMSFFHTTPTGRIINRLTKDTSDVDRNIAPMASMALRSALQLASTLGLVGIVAPFALPPLVVIMCGFYLLYSYFQASMRQVKRLDAITRSPVMSTLGEAVSGVTTLNAFRAQFASMARQAGSIDVNNATALANQSMNRWLSVRLESLGALATLMAAIVAVEQRGGASTAGLVLSFAMQVTVLMSLTLRTLSMTENLANSVERVIEYTELDHEGKGPQEGGVTGTLTAPEGWPAKGIVEFKNAYMRYRPGLPLVLRGVSFRAEACDKVGIVGRTGAGKSSMIGCLFRLTELESGVVEIDGLNIARLHLQRLRCGLAIIPQVPLLFAGSVRLNLAPVGSYTDAQLWVALRRAHLAPVIESWPAGLDSPLSEGGAPLSAGQKQLLALARALLNSSRVLVLDEATANVDVETDALIQRTMRQEFSDRTILAIAHRLHTIIDYDKVLVLDKGQVAEYGTPAALLSVPPADPGAKPGPGGQLPGLFASMVDDTGEATSKFLRAVAAGKEDMASKYEESAQDALAKLHAPSVPSAAHTAGSPNVSPGGLPGSGPSGGSNLWHVGDMGIGADGSLAGMGAGATISSLVSMLQQRAVAATKLIKEATRDLLVAAEDEEASEALLHHHPHVSAGDQLAQAQGSLMQALQMLAQVEQAAQVAAQVASKAIAPGATSSSQTLSPTPDPTQLAFPGSPFLTLPRPLQPSNSDGAHKGAGGRSSTAPQLLMTASSPAPGIPAGHVCAKPGGDITTCSRTLLQSLSRNASTRRRNTLPLSGAGGSEGLPSAGGSGYTTGYTRRSMDASIPSQQSTPRATTLPTVPEGSLGAPHASNSGTLPDPDLPRQGGDVVEAARQLAGRLGRAASRRSNTPTNEM